MSAELDKLFVDIIPRFKMDDLDKELDKAKGKIKDTGKKIADEFTSSTKESSKTVDQTVEHVGKLHRAFSGLKDGFHEFSSGYKSGMKEVMSQQDQAVAKVKKTHGAFHELFAGIASGMGIVGAVDLAKKIGGAGLDQLKQLDESNRQLQTLGLNAGQAKDILGVAREEADITGKSLTDFVEVATKAVETGVQPGEGMEKYLRSVADAAGATGQSLSSIGDLFARVNSEGLTTREWHSIIRQEPAVVPWLQDFLKTDKDGLEKMVKDHKISLQQLEDATETHVKGAAGKMSQTVEGARARLHNVVESTAADLITAITGGNAFEHAGDPINKITDQLTKVETWINNNKDAIHQFFVDLVNDAKGVWRGIDNVAKLLGGWKSSIELAAGAFAAFKTVQFISSMANIAKAVKGVTDALGLIPGKAKAAETALDDLAGAEAAAGGAGAGGALATTLGRIGSALSALTEIGLPTWLGNMIANKIDGTNTSIMDVLHQAIDAPGRIWHGITHGGDLGTGKSHTPGQDELTPGPSAESERAHRGLPPIGSSNLPGGGGGTGSVLGDILHGGARQSGIDDGSGAGLLIPGGMGGMSGGRPTPGSGLLNLPRGGSPSANKALAQSMFPWGPGEWAAFNNLEMHEAGYSATAHNPHSSAFGMGQFLDSTWGPYGAKTSDPRKQLQYMFAYIKNRYGSPSAAWAQYYQHPGGVGWYSKGGGVDTVPAMLQPGEHVFTVDDVNAMGGQNNVYAFRNALHRSGGGSIFAGPNGGGGSPYGGDWTAMNYLRHYGVIKGNGKLQPGNFNPNMKLDPSMTSIAPPYWRLTFDDVADATTLSDAEKHGVTNAMKDNQDPLWEWAKHHGYATGGEVQNPKLPGGGANGQKWISAAAQGLSAAGGWPGLVGAGINSAMAWANAGQQAAMQNGYQPTSQPVGSHNATSLSGPDAGLGGGSTGSSGGGGLLGLAEGAGATALNGLAPGAGIAAQIGMQEAQRAIQYGAQVAGILFNGVLETFDVGNSPLANPQNSLIGKIAFGIAGARPSSPGTANMGGSVGTAKKPIDPGTAPGQAPAVVQGHQYNGGVHIAEQHVHKGDEHKSNKAIERATLAQQGAGVR